MSEELKEIFELLQNAGYDPQLCDTPVHLSSCHAMCGSPTEPGQDDYSENVYLPKALVGQTPLFCIQAEGDSMIEAGIEPGDELRVRLGAPAHDGKIVLASIDSACTVKLLHIDEDGICWLVPQNRNYEPIRLDESMMVRILGVVENVTKPSPVVRSSSVARIIREYKLTHPAVSEESATETPAPPAPLPATLQPAGPVYDTSFFRSSHSYADCMDLLTKMLNSNKMQTRVLRKIFGPEGREYFDLFDTNVEEILRLLNQFPSRCGSFSKASLQKVLAEYRDIILQDQLSRLSKSPK